MVNPIHARSSRTPQDLFVNRRPIRNATVFHAVIDGYGSFLPKGAHPTFVLFLDIEPNRLDVNVHPTKREVRFAETDLLHELIRQSVRHALSGSGQEALLGLPQTMPGVSLTAERKMSPLSDSRPALSTATYRQDSQALGRDRGSLPSFDEGSQLAFAHETAGPYRQTETG